MNRSREGGPRNSGGDFGSRKIKRQDPGEVLPSKRADPSRPVTGFVWRIRDFQLPGPTVGGMTGTPEPP